MICIYSYLIYIYIYTGHPHPGYHFSQWRWRHIATTHSGRHTHALMTHCDDPFPDHTLPPGDAFPPDDTLWRHIPWRHITPWRRITLWRRIVTTHYPLTTQYPAVTAHSLTTITPWRHLATTRSPSCCMTLRIDRTRTLRVKWSQICGKESRTKRFLDCYFCFASYIGHALVAGFLITLDFCSTMFLQGGSGITP